MRLVQGAESVKVSRPLRLVQGAESVATLKIKGHSRKLLDVRAQWLISTQVDAVSYFHLDEAGKVLKHEVDRVEVNGRPLNPPYSVGWLAFREYVMAGLDAPAAVPSRSMSNMESHCLPVASSVGRPGPRR